MTPKNLLILLCLLAPLAPIAQVAERASLMRVEDPYGNAQEYQYYRLMPNGNKLFVGHMGRRINYLDWDQPVDSLPQSLSHYYYAVFNAEDSLLWVRFTNGFIESSAIDSQNNIYLAGAYKDILHTSAGDTLPYYNPYLYDPGNVFVMKLDSAGNIKWWYTSDHEGVNQDPPGANYIALDPDNNVYVSGRYHTYIRFNAEDAFLADPEFIFTNYLMKFDSTGNQKWVRDWQSREGINIGLSIDSCNIYQFSTFGVTPVNTWSRKYDFNGKLLEEKAYARQSTDLFLFQNIDIKNNRMLMPIVENDQKKISFSDLDGNPIRTVNYYSSDLVTLQFTDQNNIFFAGVTGNDTTKVGNTPVPKGLFFGIMDTMGNVMKARGIPGSMWSGIPFLGPDGKLLVNTVITALSNNNSTQFTVDGFHFDFLTHYDSVSGIGSGVYYRLFTQYDMGENLYYNPGNCNFSPASSPCLGREGLPCVPGAFTISATAECVQSKSRVTISWTASRNSTGYEVYRNGTLLGTNNTTNYIDSAVTGGQGYTYTVKATNENGNTGNSNGGFFLNAVTCAVTSVPDPANNPFEIKVAPNPSSGKYFFTTKNTAAKKIVLEVFNATGQLIYKDENKAGFTNYSRLIDITKAGNGLYFIKTTIGKDIYVVPVLKQ